MLFEKVEKRRIVTLYFKTSTVDVGECIQPQQQGRRQRGGQWCPALPFEIGAPSFRVWPPDCCIHPILYLKNLAPLLVFGPSFWFLAPLLLNPGDGPAQQHWSKQHSKVVTPQERLLSIIQFFAKVFRRLYHLPMN